MTDTARPVETSAPNALNPLTASPTELAHAYAKAWLGTDADRVRVRGDLRDILKGAWAPFGAAVVAHMAVHLALADAFALDAFTKMLDVLGEDFRSAAARVRFPEG